MWLLGSLKNYASDWLWENGGGYWSAEHRRDYILDQDGRKIMTESGKPMRGIRMTEVDYEAVQSQRNAIGILGCALICIALMIMSLFSDASLAWKNPKWMACMGLFSFMFLLSVRGVLHGVRAKNLIPTIGLDQTMSDDWDEGDHGQMPIRSAPAPKPGPDSELDVPDEDEDDDFRDVLPEFDDDETDHDESEEGVA